MKSSGIIRTCYNIRRVYRMVSAVEAGEMSVSDMLLRGGFTEAPASGFPPGYRHFVRVARGKPPYMNEPSDIVNSGVRYAQMEMELPPVPDLDVVEIEEMPPRAEVRWTRYRGTGLPETEIALFRIDGEPWDSAAASMKSRLESYAESMP